jgi:hypothetical protein
MGTEAVAEVTKRILGTLSAECAKLDDKDHLEVLYSLGSILATVATDLRLSQLKRATDEARRAEADQPPLEFRERRVPRRAFDMPQP